MCPWGGLGAGEEVWSGMRTSANRGLHTGSPCAHLGKVISSVHGVHMGHSWSQEHVSHGVKPAYRAKTQHYGAMNEDKKFMCVQSLSL